MAFSKRRKEGGRLDLKAAGNPDVFAEAEGKEDYAKGDEKKRGGKIKKKARGGRHLVQFMAGGMVKARQDKPARARGGKVGSDRNPFSSAKGSAAEEKLPKEQDGGASPE